MQNDLYQKIDNIQYSISRLTNLNTVNEKGKFPLNQAKILRVFMKLKPKRGIFKVEGGQSCDHLRSGKEVDQPLPKVRQDEELCQRKPCFTWKEEIKNSSEILEVLRQVKVNIPLLDMIKQVPTYAKFLKDLCTVKRGLHVTKNAFLTEQVSAIIQSKSPVKYKDPGCPTLQSTLEGHCGESFTRLGGKCEFAPILCVQATGTWRIEAHNHHSLLS
ncbi:hypothetical protein CK203_053924 [Vitis vinifera]|uniref:Uncharacterized protein n=1 Tax=Vitis vinifera TaxID=29760 RepID=A0A438GSG2_VITVI|nr:hypothetical protein CK203_053924 [Vitis vinifera]